jgi:hypothetical protein
MARSEGRPEHSAQRTYPINALVKDLDLEVTRLTRSTDRSGARSAVAEMTSAAGVTWKWATINKSPSLKACMLK